MIKVFNLTFDKIRFVSLVLFLLNAPMVFSATDSTKAPLLPENDLNTFHILLPGKTVKLYLANSDTIIAEIISIEKKKISLRNREFGEFYLIENSNITFEKGTNKIYIDSEVFSNIPKVIVSGPIVLMELSDSRKIYGIIKKQKRKKIVARNKYLGEFKLKKDKKSGNLETGETEYNSDLACNRTLFSRTAYTTCHNPLNIWYSYLDYLSFDYCIAPLSQLSLKMKWSDFRYASHVVYGLKQQILRENGYPLAIAITGEFAHPFSTQWDGKTFLIWNAGFNISTRLNPCTNLHTNFRYSYGKEYIESVRYFDGSNYYQYFIHKHHFIGIDMALEYQTKKHLKLFNEYLVNYKRDRDFASLSEWVIGFGTRFHFNTLTIDSGLFIRFASQEPLIYRNISDAYINNGINHFSFGPKLSIRYGIKKRN